MEKLLSVTPSLYVDFCFRLIVSGFLAGLIGFEREARSHEAGLRTHFLVGIGAALIMIVSQYGFFPVLETNVRVDPSRIAAQVVSGIGFLGAGIIFKEKGIIQGLSSAAGIWTVAGVGLAVGSGLYSLGIFSTTLVLIAFEILNRITIKYSHKSLEFNLITESAIYEELKILAKEENSFMTFYKITSILDTDKKYFSITFRLKVKENRDTLKIANKISKIKDVSTVNFEVLYK